MRNGIWIEVAAREYLMFDLRNEATVANQPVRENANGSSKVLAVLCRHKKSPAFEVIEAGLGSNLAALAGRRL